jgi:hypothetical protein
VESFPERGRFGAVFEDDGETGYFYGLDASDGDQSILDALHIYNVKDVADRYRASQLEIVWSQDHARVALLINGHPQAAFDFALKRGYCRTNFPPTSNWSVEGHVWDDAATDFLKAAT